MSFLYSRRIALGMGKPLCVYYATNLPSYILEIAVLSKLARRNIAMGSLGKLRIYNFKLEFGELYFLTNSSFIGIDHENTYMYMQQQIWMKGGHNVFVLFFNFRIIQHENYADIKDGQTS